jgi:hypothetical protein
MVGGFDDRGEERDDLRRGGMRIEEVSTSWEEDVRRMQETHHVAVFS